MKNQASKPREVTKKLPKTPDQTLKDYDNQYDYERDVFVKEYDLIAGIALAPSLKYDRSEQVKDIIRRAYDAGFSYANMIKV